MDRLVPLLEAETAVYPLLLVCMLQLIFHIVHGDVGADDLDELRSRLRVLNETGQELVHALVSVLIDQHAFVEFLSDILCRVNHLKKAFLKSGLLNVAKDNCEVFSFQARQELSNALEHGLERPLDLGKLVEK